MIQLTQGDLLKADAEALVNTVNCVGVMGRGVALQFRKAFPENYELYKQVCDRKGLRPGSVLTFDRAALHNPRYIINFPTKDHWKGKSRLPYIESGLDALIAEVRLRKIRSIALPPLGCGLGGLDWNDVRPRIEAAFADLPDVRVLLYEPTGAPDPATMVHTAMPPKMTAGRAVLLELMQRYLAGLMDVSVTLLELQKLLYFMQTDGEPLKLRYKKAPYGPYAENLRHVLNPLEGHYLLGYGDAADAPTRQLELLDDAREQAARFLKDYTETRARLDRVGDLIRGFETPFGMELLATVHWVATQEGAANPSEAAAQVWQWSERKRLFSESQIHLAYDVLRQKRWID